jgi:glycosyltransferase involved in cell wall biosynthesis
VLPASCTLIVPHQRATSGGVYVIEQLAYHLAGRAEVNLAVRRGPTHPIAGVRVLEVPRLTATELPDADVVIGGIAQPDPERVLTLPAVKGTPLLMFQGYGALGNPRVTDMLERRPQVLAVSNFLAERARTHGCAVELTRPGLDRSVFHPGAPCEERRPIVAMMTHTIDWKATDDGLAALTRVRAAVPEVELKLFGAHGKSGVAATDIGAQHLGVLSRGQVAELLRETSVFVCPSLEEGLGLPGIEALACGAALASTDTKGSRDYALHGQTALVSPPGHPEALADSVIRLLSECDLRARLCRRGHAHVSAAYPPWPRAAEGFHRAIAQLLKLAPATAPTIP